MRTLTALLFIVSLAPSTILANSNSQTSTKALHLAQKIYVEEMGTSPESARFRLLVEDQLGRKGFTVVDNAEKADAVLSGVVSVARSGFYGGPADISVTARLISSEGDRLWSGNMGGQIYILNPVSSLKFKEPIEYRAKELAKKLRSDWEKAVRH
jgi:hypothetical protein